jgi:glycosyltransferase involved in cell wall biosynthesis
MAVAVSQMIGPARNAAIFYAPDGYDPKIKGINGRRAAGEGFLSGLIRHGQIDEIVGLTQGQSDANAFAEHVARYGNNRPLRIVPLDRVQTIAPVGTLYFPSPNIAQECWRRATFGSDAYAICGITHTIATKAVMQGFFDIRSAPQMPWDAVICTSRAARDAVEFQMALGDDYLQRRFPGTVMPPPPMLPVIPLGVDAEAFAPAPGLRMSWRQTHGIGDGDLVLGVVSRLTPHEKFDPLPVYLALASARRQMPMGQGLHLILYGKFADDHARMVFVKGASDLMPEVGLHVVDGADLAQRAAVLAASDVFVFAIDNLQETFGLAPVEAMAAGLPVIASDWDGLRDTVTPDCGFLIPTQMAAPLITHHIGDRFGGGTDTYTQYLSQTAALTRIDVPAMARAVVTLAGNSDLRRRMGQAAARRALTLFDWRVVIAQMQDLWGAQDARRRAATCDTLRVAMGARPVAPSPFAMFAGFASLPPVDLHHTRLILQAPAPGKPDVTAMLALRDYDYLRRLIEDKDRFVAVAEAFRAAGAHGASAVQVAQSIGSSIASVGRVVTWLLKYDYLNESKAQDAP